MPWKHIGSSSRHWQCGLAVVVKTGIPGHPSPTSQFSDTAVLAQMAQRKDYKNNCLKVTVLWDVAPYSLVEIDRYS